jgi:hypothetical protein
MQMQLYESEIASYTVMLTSKAKCWETTVSLCSNFAMKDLGARERKASQATPLAYVFVYMLLADADNMSKDH